jgi:hypothetical protein
VSARLDEFAAAECPATDFAVAEQGGECPLCGAPAEAHQPEFLTDEQPAFAEEELESHDA